MAPRSSTADADAREAARRLIDLLQVLVPSRPGIVHAIERCVLALAVDEMRQRIGERLVRLTPENLDTLDTLTAQLLRTQGDDPLTDPDEAA